MLETTNDYKLQTKTERKRHKRRKKSTHIYRCRAWKPISQHCTANYCHRNANDSGDTRARGPGFLSLFLFLAHLLSFCCALVSIANKRARLRTHKLGRGIEKKGVLIMQSSNDVNLPVLGDSYNWQCLPAACLPVLNDCHVTGVVSFSFAFFFPLFINSSHVGSLPSWCWCCCCWHSSAPTPAPQWLIHFLCGRWNGMILWRQDDRRIYWEILLLLQCWWWWWLVFHSPMTSYQLLEQVNQGWGWTSNHHDNDDEEEAIIGKRGKGEKEDCCCLPTIRC